MENRNDSVKVMFIPRWWQEWSFQAQNRFLIRLKRPHQPPAGDGITVVVKEKAYAESLWLSGVCKYVRNIKDFYSFLSDEYEGR